MNPRRQIRAEERSLILFLLEKLKLNPADYPIASEVDDYEGGVMGSIGLGDAAVADFGGDLIQANYTDSDGVEVVISLTKDTNNQLLDLDFWKQDFSKLMVYPKAADLIF
jgi:hypothetical protein